ncbi:hypothetical protein L2E82_16753 [Cichorium intybus]|uniref:Uncharacterized protein n=1 Tax=Cichorium intybus TaxID=13427 RepID=A0ACB9F6F2_CICIN|nr:hypothetical protein L2E82_16753 [Cichorium intybus]
MLKTRPQDYSVTGMSKTPVEKTKTRLPDLNSESFSLTGMSTPNLAAIVAGSYDGISVDVGTRVVYGTSGNLKRISLSNPNMATRNYRPDSVPGTSGFRSVFKGWINDQCY